MSLGVDIFRLFFVLANHTLTDQLHYKLCFRVWISHSLPAKGRRQVSAENSQASDTIETITMMSKEFIAAFVLLGMFVLSAAQYPLHEDEDVEGLLKRYLLRKYYRKMRDQIEKRSCVPLGGTGCENNNGNCCREGNDNYTGKMRKCVNVGDFENRVYKCVKDE